MVHTKQQIFSLILGHIICLGAFIGFMCLAVLCFNRYQEPFQSELCSTEYKFNGYVTYIVRDNVNLCDDKSSFVGFDVRKYNHNVTVSTIKRCISDDLIVKHNITFKYEHKIPIDLYRRCDKNCDSHQDCNVLYNFDSCCNSYFFEPQYMQYNEIYYFRAGFGLVMLDCLVVVLWFVILFKLTINQIKQIYSKYQQKKRYEEIIETSDTLYGDL